MQVILHYRAISSFEDTPGELKHLSTQRKRKIIIDSVSSGERKRNSPNHLEWCSDRNVELSNPSEWPGKASHRR